MKTGIEKAAFDHIKSESVKVGNMRLAFGSFINGAEWADKTMIEKACEWMKLRLAARIGSEDAHEFLTEFRKAMGK